MNRFTTFLAALLIMLGATVVSGCEKKADTPADAAAEAAEEVGEAAKEVAEEVKEGAEEVKEAVEQ